jgi:hypothetical protein
VALTVESDGMSRGTDGRRSRRDPAMRVGWPVSGISEKVAWIQAKRAA